MNYNTHRKELTYMNITTQIFSKNEKLMNRDFNYRIISKKFIKYLKTSYMDKTLPPIVCWAAFPLHKTLSLFIHIIIPYVYSSIEKYSST